MKTSIVAILTVTTINLYVQLAAPAGTISANTNDPAGMVASFVVAETGPHHRVWQSTMPVTNQDGTVTAHTARYVELATSMAHLVNGEWVPSSDQFSVTPIGAEATNSQHRVAILGNLNSSGAVSLTTPEGKRLVSNLLGLSYFDTTAGNSVWVGETKDSLGELLAAGNEAVFSDAFSGCSADVLYQNTISRFEQLVVIREQLPSCTEYGMNPETTLLCVITEFLNPPEPLLVPQVVGNSADTRLDFGIMQMVHGEAFAIGSETNRVPVTKHWVKLDNRQCLVEAVPLKSVQPLLDSLPPMTASATPVSPFVHKLLASGQSSRVPGMMALPSPRRVSIEPAAFRLARALPSGKGLAMDYTILTSQTNAFTFQGDTVYYVTNTVTLSATNNVIEGLTVIRFAKLPTASIVANGLIWNTRPYAPAVFTAKDDNTIAYGDPVSGSTGTPTGYYGGVALDLSGAPGTVISNARFLYLSNALAGANLTLRNVQFVQTLNGIHTADPSPKLYNVLIQNMGSFEPVGGASGENVVFENVTAHYCTNLLSDGTATANYTNCLFVCATNWQPATLHTNASVFLDSDTGVFQTVGAGTHYLADGSPYRGIGTTNVDVTLLSDLCKKTTFPPVVYSGITISADTTFAPQAQRDAGSQVDLGWHYDPLDYIFGGCTANANVTFQEGTAAAWYRSGGYGLHLANSKMASFNGTATAPCWWVKYNDVQEQPSSAWGGGSGWAGITGTGSTLSVAPTVNANFLHCSVSAGEGG